MMVEDPSMKAASSEQLFLMGAVWMWKNLEVEYEAKAQEMMYMGGFTLGDLKRSVFNGEVNR